MLFPQCLYLYNKRAGSPDTATSEDSADTMLFQLLEHRAGTRKTLPSRAGRNCLQHTLQHSTMLFRTAIFACYHTESRLCICPKSLLSASPHHHPLHPHATMPPPPPSRLDGLPDEALTHIVRHLSASPSRSDWQSYVRHEDALAAVQAPGSFASIARAAFTSVTVGKLNARSREGALRWRKGVGFEGSLHLPGSLSVLLEWAWAAGGSMAVLKLGRDLQLTDVAEGSLLDSLKDECGGLRRLDIGSMHEHPFAGKVLRALAGRLRSLSASHHQVPAIVKSCKGLVELSLLTAPPDMRDVLRVVGPTLQSLKIHVLKRRIVPTMLLTQAFCLAVTRIDFGNILESRNCTAYAALLASYGRQLRFAYIGGLSKRLCKKVVAACPNMRCEAELSGEDAVAKMEVLGASIQSLLVKGDVPVQNLARAAQACVNIEIIALFVKSARAADTIGQILCVHKPMLTSFKLCVQDRGNFDDALRELSERASELVHLNCNVFPESFSSLKVFASRESMLETVDFRMNSRTDRYEEFVGDVVKSFVACPRMRELTVAGEGKQQGRLHGIADLCCRVERTEQRGMSVDILGVKYSA